MRLQKLKSAIRKLGILPALDTVRYITHYNKNKIRNRKFLKEHPGFIPPPNRAAYDAYTTIEYAQYFQSGKKEAEILMELIDKHSNGKSVLDFGCGSARILRHFPQNKFDLHGSDYNSEAIGWCRKNFSNIKFSVNGLRPPLKYPDNTFNFIYAISVFTHLSEEVQHLWLAELGRICVNGGCILLTLHGERHKNKLLPEELQKFENNEIVIKGNVREGSRIFTSYHKDAGKNLLKGKEIVSFSSQPWHSGFTQDIYLVKVNK